MFFFFLCVCLNIYQQTSKITKTDRKSIPETYLHFLLVTVYKP